MSKQKKNDSDILGRRLGDLLDDKKQDELVNAQLNEMARCAQAAPPVAPPQTELSGTDKPPEADRGASTKATVKPTNVVRSTPSSTIQVEDIEVLESFLQETSEHLDTVEEKIVQLEKTHSPKILDEIFRAMHTIKGTSAFFGKNAVTALSHSLESLLDGLRQGKMMVTAELIDLLLAGADELSRMNTELSAEFAAQGARKPPFTLDIGNGNLDSLLDRISLLESGQKPGSVKSPMDSAASGETPAAAPSSTSDSTSNFMSASAAGPPPAAETAATLELYQHFVSETSDLLADVETDILAIEKDPNNLTHIERPFRNIHTIKGNAGFLGLGKVEELCVQIEEVLEVLRSRERRVSPAIITAILRSIDSLGHLVRDSGDYSEEAEIEAAGESKAEYHPLGAILVEMGLTDEETINKALDSQERKIGEILVSDGLVSNEAVSEALSRQLKTAKSSGSRELSAGEHNVIRVDVSKLDKLFELVGELIMAEAMVVSNPDLEGLELERFDRSASYLGKITRQMQEITMSVRMIPLEGLFNKMRRLVRDLSRRTGKPVELIISGQDTEMDRNVIEVLADPLVHMLRNCVDHGIESAADRKKAGKSKEGHIRLSAHYEGSEIWITIRDDGAGLNKQSIVKKALDRGLTNEEELEKLSDEKIWEFLFQAGFSTAETVSDVSGRGVGMDVVRQNIEKLRGKIDIDTEPGAWTEVTLKIPLTLAIIDGVTTRVGQTLYAIPLGDIREFQRAQAERIQETNTSGEVFSLRDEIIPIIRLQEFFRGTRKSGANGQAAFIVVQSGSERAALLVDEIVAYSQIVVKALPDYLGQMDGISGCSVLGNGDVSLIVDTSSLIKGREKAAVR